MTFFGDDDAQLRRVRRARHLQPMLFRGCWAIGVHLAGADHVCWTRKAFHNQCCLGRRGCKHHRVCGREKLHLIKFSIEAVTSNVRSTLTLTLSIVRQLTRLGAQSSLFLLVVSRGVPVSSTGKNAAQHNCKESRHDPTLIRLCINTFFFRRSTALDPRAWRPHRTPLPCTCQRHSQ